MAVRLIRENLEFKENGNIREIPSSEMENCLSEIVSQLYTSGMNSNDNLMMIDGIIRSYSKITKRNVK